MKEIILTQNQVALVDDEDFERLNQFKWHAAKDRNIFYAARHSSITKCRILMHCEIMGKPPKGSEIDHKNGNGLWNLKNNLRFVTHRQNCQNKKNGRKKSSKYPGVCWNKQYQKWVAEIQINGTKKWLGRFMKENDAFNAYRQAINAIGEKVIDI